MIEEKWTEPKRPVWHMINIEIIKISEREEKKWQKLFEEIMAKNFPNVMQYMNINIQGIQWTSRKMKSKNHTETHNPIFKKQKQRDNLERSKYEVTHHIQGILNKIIRRFFNQKLLRP